MRELYIIRHGLAGSRHENEMDDEQRPLKKKGKEQMKSVAKRLKEREISFDIVFTSPLLRAKESAEIVHAHCGASKDLIVTDLLKPGSTYNKLIKFLNALQDPATVALVGHEPFLSGFASYCLTKNEGSFIDLKKGGVIKLEVDQVIKPGCCLLTWLAQPSDII